jgi:hypothetical protein
VWNSRFDLRAGIGISSRCLWPRFTGYGVWDSRFPRSQNLGHPDLVVMARLLG